MIQLQSVQLQLGTKVLLDHVDMTIHPGQNWGIIGANGAGKSSLFKLLLGEVHEDSGTCAIPSHWQIAHMAQEVGSTTQSAIDYVLDGDEELRQIERDIEAHQDDGEKLATLYGRMETIDGYSARSRAQRLLHGLGFAISDDNRPVKDFSGGWRIRLNLAKALMCRSDLLLLDEPTNHLDLDATVWLEQWLQAYPGTLLIISHDRDFLDNVINGIVSFEGGKLISYSGNYSAFEKQKAERLAQQSQAFEKQQERISEIEDFVRRFRAKASKAKQAQSRLKELERMEKIAPAHIDSPFSFRFPLPDKIPSTIINLSEAAIGYQTESGDKVLADKIQLSILASSRIGLLGHNGAGKTTLIKTLANALPLLKGDKVEGTHIAIGYYAQHQLEALDLKASAALHLQRLSPKASEQEVRNFLGSFGFHGDRAFEVITHFSGGEKARLALAIIAWQKPNILLMDEPTNHLDLEMRHALTLALQGFEGALVVVSHDRHLLKNTVDQYVLVDHGKVEEFDGTLEDYQRWVMSQEAQEVEAPVEPVMGDSAFKKVDKKEQRQMAAALREKLKPLTNQVKKLEKDIESLQATLEKVEQKLADPQIYENPGPELEKLLKEQAQAKQSLEEKEELWLEKSEELESLKV
ncbi:putative ABC transporter ATP-binding protein YheS [Thalassocella blandensis]|nr:putative ABC transporter ATP-binding protein YheS [Thalassocella blandensis]